MEISSGVVELISDHFFCSCRFTRTWSNAYACIWPFGTHLEMNQCIQFKVDYLYFTGQACHFNGFLQDTWTEGKEIGGSIIGMTVKRCLNKRGYSGQGW